MRELCLLPALLASRAAAQSAPELIAVHGLGDPAALAVSADERWIYAAEGATVALLDATDVERGTLAERGRAAVDAAIVALTWTPERLLVAGGSQGLLALELEPFGSSARAIDDAGDLVCTDAELVGETVAALFAARDVSELRLYERATLAPLSSVPLGPGTAMALAAGQDELWVAMGAGGLARVDLSDPRAPRVEAGPRGSTFPAPEGFQLTPGVVRDVAYDGARLWAAADGAGLAEIDAGAPWSRATPVRLHPLLVRGAITYASRVAVRGTRIAVGTNLGPVEAQDGAPYNAFGKMSRYGAAGGVGVDAYRRGSAEGLLLFERRGEVLHPLAEHTLAGGWRSLVLGLERLYEQHIGEGLIVRAFAGVTSPAILARRKPRGFPAADGVFSTVDARRLWFGVDSAGSLAPDHQLSIGPDGLVADLSPGASEIGLFAGASWPGDQDRSEWLLGSTSSGFRLLRFEHGDSLELVSWTLGGAASSQAIGAHTFHHSRSAGEFVLGVRYGVRRGLIGWRRSALVRAATDAEPGATLDVPIAFELATHAEAEPGPLRSWRVNALERADGSWLIAVAAGACTALADPNAGRSKLALFQMDGEPGSIPRALGFAYGSRAPGNAIAVDLIEAGGRVLAVVADTASGVAVLDLADPLRPRAMGAWEPPPNVFDGVADVALDVEVDRAGADGRRMAYVACARRGLVCLALAPDGEVCLREIATLDTPGLAYGVALQRADGVARLALGDHQAGLRLYRLP